MRGGPLSLTLIPIAYNCWVWMDAMAAFNPKWKTNPSKKILILMILCGGGLGALIAAISCRLRSFKMWMIILVGSLIDLIGSFLIFKLVYFLVTS